jgi:hypothetical protein
MEAMKGAELRVRMSQHEFSALLIETRVVLVPVPMLPWSQEVVMTGLTLMLVQRGFFWQAEPRKECSTNIFLNSRSTDRSAEKVRNDAEARPGVSREDVDAMINDCRQSRESSLRTPLSGARSFKAMEKSLMMIANLLRM